MIYADALVESIEVCEVHPVLFIWNGRRRWNEFRYNWIRLSI